MKESDWPVHPNDDPSPVARRPEVALMGGGVLTRIVLGLLMAPGRLASACRSAPAGEARPTIARFPRGAPCYRAHAKGPQWGLIVYR